MSSGGDSELTLELLETFCWAESWEWECHGLPQQGVRAPVSQNSWCELEEGMQFFFLAAADAA